MMKRKTSFLSPLAACMAAVILFASCNESSRGGEDSMNARVSVNDTASIFFSKLTHDFGKITEGEKVACIFTFENRGTGPLVISSATSSCGCTVPEFSRKPVEPGGKGTMEVVFDSSGRHGRQTKTVTVQSNATKPVVLLTITGEIITGK